MDNMGDNLEIATNTGAPLAVTEDDLKRRVRIDEPDKPIRYGVITNAGGLRARSMSAGMGTIGRPHTLRCACSGLENEGTPML